jgi:hypothetical protein
MASYVGANEPLSSSGSKPARQLGQFPPAPKSVRVVSVFGEAQPVRTVESPTTVKPEVRFVRLWALWALAFTVILGLVIAAILGARFGNYPPI